MAIKTQLVGIINVTPDSFSDGGLYETPEAVLKAIERQIAEGADVIDIGAESTRPGAIALSSAEEWKRLEPVLGGLKQFSHLPIKFSLDTRHAETAAHALNYNIDWINDVSGFSDVRMINAVRESACKLVVMHSLTVPADKSIVLPEHADVIQTLMQFAEDRIYSLSKAGISKDRILFDPGIGFGKTAVQSLYILKNIAELKHLGVPLLVGHSRKSFLGEKTIHRDEATLIISQYLIGHDVDYLRVHGVSTHQRMLHLLKELTDAK